MTPGECSIVQSLIVLAWADGQVVDGELGVIEGLLCGFDATEEEEQQLLEFARTPRSLDELPVGELCASDRVLLMENAVLLARADGETSAQEVQMLQRLSELLGVPVPASG